MEPRDVRVDNDERGGARDGAGDEVSRLIAPEMLVEIEADAVAGGA